MENQAHRWEWRVFGARFPVAEQVLGELTPTGDPQVTEETYLLGNDQVNVKIRFDLLDVKTLVEVDENGLELWAPELKAEFPISAHDVSTIHDIWAKKTPDTTRARYTEPQFLDELITPDPDLDIAEVHKRRVRYTLEDCMAETALVTVRDRSTRTLAIEAEDPDAVWRLVERLGLSSHVNMSYSRGLRLLLGRSPVRYAVVDIGTNSVKFHVGEQHPDLTWARVIDRAAVTRLGEGLAETGEIQAGPLERTIETVAEMTEEAKSSGAIALAAVGTAALRNATNSGPALGRIKESAGLSVRVLSGEEESRLAYLAVKASTGLSDGSMVVFDTGGGSTQVTFGRGDDVLERFSVDVGAVGYTEQFELDGAVSQTTLTEVSRSLADDLARLDGRESPEVLVGMGGAITNLTAVSRSMAVYDPDAVQGATLDVAEIDRQIKAYASMNAGQRRSITGLQPNRAPVILAGALIVRAVMEKMAKDTLVVSDRGLRHGLIQEMFGFYLDPTHHENGD
jgi:exopolyphosphatase/guanosine-5'-triphosphate,3'-diphosphate pyrophosphatase